MYRLKFYISSLYFFSVALLTEALWANNDITSENFKIDLSNLDPVHTGGAPIATGFGAVTTLLDKISGLLLFVMPIIAGVSMIIAGYYYILSSGDSEKANIAKRIVQWNVVAIMIALFSYVIVRGLALILSSIA